jgi:hypothetical protein
MPLFNHWYPPLVLAIDADQNILTIFEDHTH